MAPVARVIKALTSDRTWSFLYVVPVVVAGVLLIAVLSSPGSDSQSLAAIALGCAVASLIACWLWAARLSRIAPTDELYVSGTTSARMMLAFWGLLALSSILGQAFGFDPTYVMPLLEGPLTGFIGIGSVLLTIGPAYKEYKEACAASTAEKPETDTQIPDKAGSSCRPLRLYVPVLVGTAGLLLLRLARHSNK